MPNNVDLRCKVFVDADVARNALVGMIAHTLGGTVVQRDIVEAGGAEIYVDDNEDFRSISLRASDAQFLYYRYYLDISPCPGQDLGAQIKVVTRLLEYLWSQGFSAVAASDYEEDLPRRGGYHENVPRKE